MRLKILGLMVLLQALSGCATVTTSSPPPVSSAGTTVEVSADGAGMNDYPLGTYKIPDSQVLVVKHRGMSTVEGGFGLLGVMAADSDGKKKSREAMAGTEGAFGLDVAAITQDAFRKKLSEAGAPGNWRLARENAAGGTMEVTPYAFISPMASGDARIYVFLKSKYRDGGGKDWASRYIYHGVEIRPLAGPGSWSENDGARFRQAVTQGVAAAVDAMLTDAQSNWPEHRQASVTARFAMGLDEPETLAGVVLKETGDVKVFSPHISDAVIYYGVHIIPKSGRVAKY